MLILYDQNKAVDEASMPQVKGRKIKKERE